MKRQHNIPGLTNSDMEKLDSVFQSESRIDSVILYGSRAKGNFRPRSGLDLTCKAPGFSMSDLASLEMKLDDLLLPYNLDLSIYHHIDNQELLSHINRAGVTIYD